MITPRVTRLVRVPDLRALQRTVRDLTSGTAGGGDSESVVIVPTRGAAIQLGRILGNSEGTPECVTRQELYERLWKSLPAAPTLLSGFEREVLLHAAARTVEKARPRAPFKLRAGLMVEVLRFYDELRRNLKTVDDFHRLLTEELSAVADTDRGAERLLRQAEFLAEAFAEFERRVSVSGRVDEHGLRSLLLALPTPASSHVVIAVPDRAADEHGLWPADFDLLARLPYVAKIDVVATERLLASGFYHRLHERHLPGIEDVVMGSPSAPPALVVPTAPPGAKTVVAFTCRDREEELVSFVRMLTERNPGTPVGRAAFVFQRPLPYLYLARQVFGSARLPFQALDAFPLAAEPIAAALDLVLTFVGSEGTRSSTVALLESPHWTFIDPESKETVQRSHVDALDAWLRDTKFLGGWSQLHALIERTAHSAPGQSAAIALRAVLAAARELEAAIEANAASIQIDAVLSFVHSHEAPPAPTDAWHERHQRARAALVEGLAGLRDAHRVHDDEPLPFRELAAAIRRWIEGQTFELRGSTTGPFVIDARAAAFTDVDFVRVGGLVDTDWPERSSGSIFFPSRLLEPLGWPTQPDRLSAARAQFQDLLHLPSVEISASVFSLEDDALVASSAFVDELAPAGLVTVREERLDTSSRLFDHDVLTEDPVDASGLDDGVRQWLAFRQQLAPADAAQFHGAAGRRAPATYAVSHLERYLACPFKYFAERVLHIDEERVEESGLTPQERGQFLHRVFETFFAEWSSAGHTTITADSLEPALEMFEHVAERHLAGLREADRALERTYLLGSAVAPGLAERAFSFEIEHGVPVIERLLEYGLEGTFVFAGPDGSREIGLRAKADRIDLLDDGTLRIIDYKIGRAPKLSRSLQLPVYSLCAQQDLAGRHRRDWTISRAGYIAFKEKNAFVSIGASLDKALLEGQHRLISAVEGIEAGSFPPRPDEPWLCSRCGYALVCRKDYVGDD